MGYKQFCSRVTFCLHTKKKKCTSLCLLCKYSPQRLLAATNHVAFPEPGKTSPRMKITHPEMWQANCSGLGGPLVATHEFGAWRFQAKIHTPVTLSWEGGRRWDMA